MKGQVGAKLNQVIGVMRCLAKKRDLVEKSYTPTEMKKKTLLSWALMFVGLSTAPVYGARRPPSSTPPPIVVTTTVDRPIISAL